MAKNLEAAKPALPHLRKTSDYYRDVQGRLWKSTKKGWKLMKEAKKNAS